MANDLLFHSALTPVCEGDLVAGTQVQHCCDYSAQGTDYEQQDTLLLFLCVKAAAVVVDVERL